MNDLVDEMIEAVDDGDGEIDYDEFVSMIQKYWITYCTFASCILYFVSICCIPILEVTNK